MIPRFPRPLAALLLLALPALASAAAAPRPNVVLLMGDDHGWDETGYNGHPHLKTPVLDEMARTGLRLDRFYSGGASCSPTRGTVMTGRNHNRYGIYAPGWSLRPEEITVAHLLRGAGYTTGHFGKWHLGAVKAASPVNPGRMGFDTWVSHDNFFELDPHLSRNGGPPERIVGESSEIVIAEAIRFIDRAKAAGQPFLAVVWFGSPHEPYQARPEDLALYDELPAYVVGQRKVRLTSNLTGKNVTRLQRDVLRERFAEISAMDRSIGQLRAHLRRQGLAEDTLLWYCGDNGTPQEAVATVPFRGWKGSVYEGGIRVPGVIEWPARLRAARATNVAAVTNDILPTLCDLIGVPPPARPLDGTSLVPLFTGAALARPAPLVFWNARSRGGAAARAKPYLDPELQRGTTPLVKLGPDGTATRNFQNLIQTEVTAEDFAGERAIVEDRFKLVIDGSTAGRTELFDLAADPAEKTDVSARHPAEAERLARALRTAQESILRSRTGADYR